MKTFAVIALGCKVNQYDAAAIAGRLARLGLRRVQPESRPDVCLVQTCAVTAQACRKSRHAIRDAGLLASRVIVAGCADKDIAPVADRSVLILDNPQQPDAMAKLSAWLGLAGTPARQDISSGGRSRTVQAAGLGPSQDDEWISPSVVEPSTVCATRDDHGQRPAISPMPNIRPGRGLVKQNFFPPPHFPRQARAFVKVQDGCDAHCTFCIVPRMRPVVRSRSADEVLAEISLLADEGFREIVLCGVFLGGYGRATAVRSRWPALRGQRPPLVELLAAVTATPGVGRVRLSSLEPGDVTDSLLDLLANQPAIMPHLHLPLQSGSDRILKRMNRQYDVGQFLSTAKRLRSALDRPAITTDVLVGFPGESETDFQSTLDVVRDVGVAHMHAFAFSPRPGTSASQWRSEFLPQPIVRERMTRLAQLGDRLGVEYRRQFIGQTQQVVIEWPDSPGELNRRGRSERYFMVRFAADRSAGGNGADELARRIGHVRIDAVTPDAASGTLISVDD